MVVVAHLRIIRLQMGQIGPKMRKKTSMFRLFSREIPHNCCF